MTILFLFYTFLANCTSKLTKLIIQSKRCSCVTTKKAAVRNYFNVDLRVHLAQVVHHTVQVELAGS